MQCQYGFDVERWDRSFGEAQSQFQSGDDKSAAATMKQFIAIWPTIEEMLAANPSLYTRVESENPRSLWSGKERLSEKLQKAIKDTVAITTDNFLQRL